MFERLKALFARRPPLKMRHPVLGELELDTGLWRGTFNHGGKTLEVVAVGGEQGPDAEMLAALLGRLGRINELEDQVVAFLTAQLHELVPKVNVGDFTMTSVDFLWKGDPGHFMVGLSFEGDDYGLWRIEFAQGAPAFLGRDD